jgi:hypothetical protein
MFEQNIKKNEEQKLGLKKQTTLPPKKEVPIQPNSQNPPLNDQQFQAPLNSSRVQSNTNAVLGTNNAGSTTNQAKDDGAGTSSVNNLKSIFEKKNTTIDPNKKSKLYLDIN